MEPEIVDVAPMALYNAVRYNYPDLAGCTMVLDIGARTSNLLFIEESRIFSRSIPVAGNTVTQEIAKELDVSAEEAERLKTENSVVGLGGVYAGPDGAAADLISKVVRNVVTRLHAEVNRSINFYRSQQGGNARSDSSRMADSSNLPHRAHLHAVPAGQAGDILAKYGSAPLPPYIHRGQATQKPPAEECRERDLHRYQTVYARQPGAVAAPTAGLHFTQPILRDLESIRRDSQALDARLVMTSFLWMVRDGMVLDPRRQPSFRSYFAYLNEGIYKTVDGGASWSPAFGEMRNYDATKGEFGRPKILNPITAGGFGGIARIASAAERGYPAYGTPA
jgi:hypothetical protein